jgi:molybdopterin synthase sulfur carrier subunit
MSVEVLLPGVLADLIGGDRRLDVDLPDDSTVADLLAALTERHPVLGRRLRDETGAVRRFVNIYVDGEDIRRTAGLNTKLDKNSTVQILPSVAGGGA